MSLRRGIDSRPLRPLCACITATLLATLLVGGPALADDGPRAQTEKVAAKTAEKLFATKVLPLLKARCFACHGDDPKDIRGDLNLTSREGMLAGGKRAVPALVEGKPEKSLIYVAVTRTDADLKMPPKENDKLADAEVTIIRDWIAGGAPWPSASRIAELAASDWDAPGA